MLLIMPPLSGGTQEQARLYGLRDDEVSAEIIGLGLEQQP